MQYKIHSHTYINLPCVHNIFPDTVCKLGLLGNSQVFKVFYTFKISEKNQLHFSKCLLHVPEVYSQKFNTVGNKN